MSLQIPERRLVVGALALTCMVISAGCSNPRKIVLSRYDLIPGRTVEGVVLMDSGSLFPVQVGLSADPENAVSLPATVWVPPFSSTSSRFVITAGDAPNDDIRIRAAGRDRTVVRTVRIGGAGEAAMAAPEDFGPGYVPVSIEFEADPMRQNDERPSNRVYMGDSKGNLERNLVLSYSPPEAVRAGTEYSVVVPADADYSEYFRINVAPDAPLGVLTVTVYEQLQEGEALEEFVEIIASSQ